MFFCLFFFFHFVHLFVVFLSTSLHFDHHIWMFCILFYYSQHAVFFKIAADEWLIVVCVCLFFRQYLHQKTNSKIKTKKWQINTSANYIASKSPTENSNLNSYMGKINVARFSSHTATMWLYVNWKKRLRWRRKKGIWAREKTHVLYIRKYFCSKNIWTIGRVIQIRAL